MMRNTYMPFLMAMCLTATQLTVAKSAFEQAVYEAEQAYKAANEMSDAEMMNQPYTLNDMENMLASTFKLEQQGDMNALFKPEDMGGVILQSLDPSAIHSMVKLLYATDSVPNEPLRNLELLQNNQYATISRSYIEECHCSGELKTIQQKKLIVPQKVIEFKNLKNEARFLLPIENWLIENTMSQNFIGEPKLELFLFRKLQNGQYQLVTRTPKDYQVVEMNYDDSSIMLNPQMYIDIQKNITHIGKGRIGSYFDLQKRYAGAATYSKWHVLSLKEDEWMRAYPLLEASENTTEMMMSDNIAFKFDSEFSFIQDQQQSYFPIQIKYTGTKYDVLQEKIVDKNQIIQLEFNPKMKIYTYPKATIDKMLAERNSLIE